MNKTKIIQNVARSTGRTKASVEHVIEATLFEIAKALQSNDDVRFSGFGKFETFYRTPRWGVNPRNPKERIQMKGVTIARFRPGTQLKEALKGINENNSKQ